jgi:hypothetical protein
MLQLNLYLDYLTFFWLSPFGNFLLSFLAYLLLWLCLCSSPILFTARLVALVAVFFSFGLLAFLLSVNM